VRTGHRHPCQPPAEPRPRPSAAATAPHSVSCGRIRAGKVRGIVKGRKISFCEQKEAKKLFEIRSILLKTAINQLTKVFWFFFTKKNYFFKKK
jgi:hypothetical protein